MTGIDRLDGAVGGTNCTRGGRSPGPTSDRIDSTSDVSKLDVISHFDPMEQHAT